MPGDCRSHCPAPVGASAHLCAPLPGRYGMESSLCLQAGGPQERWCLPEGTQPGCGGRAQVERVRLGLHQTLLCPLASASQETGQSHNPPVQSQESCLLVKCVTQSWRRQVSLLLSKRRWAEAGSRFRTPPRRPSALRQVLHRVLDNFPREVREAESDPGCLCPWETWAASRVHPSVFPLGKVGASLLGTVTG